MFVALLFRLFSHLVCIKKRFSYADCYKVSIHIFVFKIKEMWNQTTFTPCPKSTNLKTRLQEVSGFFSDFEDQSSKHFNGASSRPCREEKFLNRTR